VISKSNPLVECLHTLQRHNQLTFLRLSVSETEKSEKEQGKEEGKKKTQQDQFLFIGWKKKKQYPLLS
jgi:hypothetical protein